VGAGADHRQLLSIAANRRRVMRLSPVWISHSAGHLLGVRAAGAYIALFGGFGAAFAIGSSSLVLWAMTHAGVAQDAALTQALYFLGYALGGPGYSVPLGLLMAGISVPLLFYRIVPRWIPILGLWLAACGELSWLNLEFPSALFLIPLTRFPGFVWMIAVGFALPATTERTQ
jgi:hypothetical protein